MANKILKIDTILGAATNLDETDPLLLTNLDGQEGVSIPFSYDLVLMRRLAEDGGGEVAANMLLGTSARIGLLERDVFGKPHYHHRVGSFAQFEKMGLSSSARRLVYKARLIPAVMLWGAGIGFRVFEKMNVIDIIKEVLEGIRAHSGDVRYHLALRAQDFPRLAYCVQFRESSFGFLCRLMAEHGISYFFDRGKDNGPGGGNPGSLSAENDTLVLVGPHDVAATACAIGKLDAKNIDIADKIGNQTTIANFTRSFSMSHRNAVAGNFNILSPTRPLHAEKPIPRAYDVMAFESPPKASVLRHEEFPVPMDKDPDAEDVKKRAPNDPAVDEDRFIVEYVEEAIREKALEVFKVSGMVKNPTFVAGRTFEIVHDETLGQFDQRRFLLTWLKINAVDNTYMGSSGEDIGDALLGIGNGMLNAVLFNIPKSLAEPDPGKRVDVTSAIVSSAWGNYLQNEAAVWVNNLMYPHVNNTRVLPALGGGLGQLWATLLFGNIATAIKDVINANSGGFTIQFSAVPWDHGLFLRPQVKAPRPVAHGPHLATVVGPKGLRKGQIHADHQLGRVRVRFPWQLNIPACADNSGSVDAPSKTTDPFDNDRACAWVPVSQAWAGAHFGSQFLPRIGDQVLVDFVDGDPERPIISGRVYHAEHQYSNLPFLNKNLAGQQITSKTLFEASGHSDLTLSGFETRSTPKPKDGDERYHLLRFDDKYDDEQLLIRSQARLDVTAKRSNYETTEGNRHVRVSAGKNKDGDTYGGGCFITTGGEYDLHVGDDRYERVDKGYQLTVKGDTQLDLKGNCIGVVGGNLSLNAATIVIEASQKLTLKVGCSTVVLNPSGVYLDGAMIYKQCGGPADGAADAQIKDVVDAEKADPGEPACMRTESGGGGGAKRGEHPVPAQHGPDCTLDPEHMICVRLPTLCTVDGAGQ
jgi:uncharacterized protein involved in type VI secretion and phage assembly